MAPSWLSSCFTLTIQLLLTNVLAADWPRLPLAHHSNTSNVAACLLARDAHLDVRDWVEWHHWIGVDKVFLYDHNSAPPMVGEITDYVQAGIVQYTYFTSETHFTYSPNGRRQGGWRNSLQGRVFSHCFAQARGYFNWMLFTDVDEFVLVTDPKYNYSLPALLRNYGEAGAVLMHWKYAGSGGVKERSRGMPAMTTFTKCLPNLNTHVKGIANLKYSAPGKNAHLFSYMRPHAGIRAGDDRRGFGHRVYDPPPNPPLVLMHYIRSEAEWKLAIGKHSRRRVSGGSGKNARWNQFIAENANETCTRGKVAFEQMREAKLVRSLRP